MRARVVWLLVACIGASIAQAQCLNYDPDVVTLQGVLYLKLFYGPPNFGENPETDAKDEQYLLKLDAPICVNPDGQVKSFNNEAESGLTDVQLVVNDPKFWPLLKRGLDHRIKATGTLYHAHTAHHRTKVLLWLKDVSDAV